MISLSSRWERSDSSLTESIEIGLRALLLNLVTKIR